jgi:hypothetical protein
MAFYSAASVAPEEKQLLGNLISMQVAWALGFGHLLNA